MATNSWAPGEASTAKFDTIYSKEFFNNGRESFRLCVTQVNGKFKVNLSKFWFNFEEQDWIPTKQHFFFNPEAWETFAAKLSQIGKEIGKLGLSGLPFSFTFVLPPFPSHDFHFSLFLFCNQSNF